MTPNSTFTRVTSLLLLLFVSVFAAAQNKVVIIPLSGDDLKPLKNIISVAKANGDFTNPATAVASISDASASNPYLVVIAPGVYTLPDPLMMQPFVDVAGSGENVTKLFGVISAGPPNTSAIVHGANNSELSNLTVENGGGDSNAIGVYTSGLDRTAVFRHMTATATNIGTGSSHYGIYNTSSSPTITQVTANGSNGTSRNAGIYNTGSSSNALISQVTSTGSGASASFNYGVYNDQTSWPEMTQVIATATGGSFRAHGVLNNGASSRTLTMTQVTATGSGAATDNYGVYQVNGIDAVIRQSVMSGTSFGLITFGSDVTVSQSTILNGVSINSGGSLSCVASDNGAGGELTAGCL